MKPHKKEWLDVCAELMDEGEAKRRMTEIVTSESRGTEFCMDLLAISWVCYRVYRDENEPIGNEIHEKAIRVASFIESMRETVGCTQKT